MSRVIRIDEGEIRGHLDKLVRGTVEETLNALLDAEADEMCRAQRYERSPDRVDTRAGHYTRKLQTKAGEVEIKVPKLRRQTFETAIIERYRRREISIEEAIVQMYLAGVSVRRVEDITEALWGTRVSSGTVSKLNQKVYQHIERWRNQELEGEFPYVYLDGIILKRSWGGEVKNVSVLVAIGVGSDGFRRILGVAEGEKEDKAGWLSFLKHLKQRGLKGVRLIISDACLGLVEALEETYPEAAWQRCVVHFYRNVFSHVPNGKVREVAAMLKAIHAQESRAAAQNKAQDVVKALRSMKLRHAAELVEKHIEETLTYYRYPSEHWLKLKTNNPMERLLREVRRRTKVVGAFPDGHSALMLVAARLRHVSATSWGTRKYMNMKLLEEMERHAVHSAA
ncbi:MAG TPA: IS256 family transposase [Gammaproteobacteria bacterium]